MKFNNNLPLSLGTKIRSYAVRTRLAVFILLFAVVGVILLVVSKAATPSIGIEAENGSISWPASKVDDTSASGGKYIKFGTGGSNLITDSNRSRLGVDINDLPSGITLTKAYDTIASLGFGWVRTGPSMTNYRNTSYPDLTKFDPEIKLAKDRNLKIMAVITYAYSDCSGGHCAPSDPAAYARYTGKLVAHWKATYPGVVRAIEVWNEANNGQFWNPVSPTKYADLLKRTYLETKVADPSMTVIASGPAPGGGNQAADKGNTSDDPMNPATWYKQLYANGIKGFFDAAANHPYDTRNLAANTTMSGLRNTFWIRKVMDANGDNSKQIWSTEAGVVSCLKGPGNNPPMTEKQRSDRLAADLKDFWYGVHDQNDGHTTGYASKDDWKAGPYFVFKLYKTTGDSGLGIVYNTNSYMRNPPASELPNSGGASEPLCKSSPDYFQPVEADAIKFISQATQ